MSTIPITLDALVDALTLRDLTDPAQGPHAMQLLVEAAVAAPNASPDIHLVRVPAVVPVQDHYDRLGYPADAVARDTRYTRYISDALVLRGHTSAGVPPTLRRLATANPSSDDVLVALPGICHRRDVIDRLHTGTPHQLDLWRLQRGGRRLDSGDLERMVDDVVTALLPGRTWRWTSTSHPYTREGRQVDVVDDDQLVEVAECGLAAPHVLAAAGMEPRDWSGLALGIGLDRISCFAREFRTFASSVRGIRGSVRRCSICLPTGRSRIFRRPAQPVDRRHGGSRCGNLGRSGSGGTRRRRRSGGRGRDPRDHLPR